MLMLVAAGPARADIMLGLAQDARVGEDGTVVGAAATTFNVGKTGTSALDYCAVFVFQLPNLGTVTNPFLMTDFFFNYVTNNGNPADVDLYALPRRSSPTVLPSDYYGQTAVVDPSNASLIQANILDGTTTPGSENLWTSADETALRNFLNTQYAGGAGAGQYVFLRFSSRGSPNGTPYHQITSADGGAAAPKDTRPRIVYSLYPTTAWRHPNILAGPDDRQAMLDRIQNNAAAAATRDDMIDTVRTAVNTHVTSPQTELAAIPAFGTSAGDHMRILNRAGDAAILHFITQDAKYGQYAADILSDYLLKISHFTVDEFVAAAAAGGVVASTAGDDQKKIFPALALAYDFLQPFLTNSSTTVYKLATGNRVPFNNAAAQQAMLNLATSQLNPNDPPDVGGQQAANFDMITGDAALYPVLCLDDPLNREILWDVFWDKGCKGQSSFTRSVLRMPGPQGIWPESSGYGQKTPMKFFEIINRFKPELGVIQNNVNILEGSTLRLELASPGALWFRYGDANREVGSLDNVPLAFQLAHLGGVTNSQRKLEAALKGYASEHGQNSGNWAWEPQNSGSNKDSPNGYNPPWPILQDRIPWDPAVVKKDPLLARTAIIEYAGIAILRNWVTNNNATYGLGGYIGCARYTHANESGLNLELYGSGYFMAPASGLTGGTSRSDVAWKGYDRLRAGNNTVVVNGTSQGNLGQAVNIACEPAHLAVPVSPNFGFATQYVDDNDNNCVQQRTLCILRTSSTTGFYLDIFRSKSTQTNLFHDYIYHNLGDSMTITDDQGVPLALSPSTKYQNDIGDKYGSPGWRYFTNTQSSAAVTGAVRVKFNLNFNNRSMNVLLPGGVAREYASALGPSTSDAENGYEQKDTQILAIRQNGAAWNKPFAAVFEPVKNADGSTVTNLTALNQGVVTAGYKIESVVNGQPIVHYVFSNPNPDDAYTNNAIGLLFQGRFGIVADYGGGKVDLYLGDARSLSYRGNAVSSVGGTNVQAEARFTPGQAPAVVANQSVTTVTANAPAFTLITRDTTGTVSLWAAGSNSVPYTLWSTTNLTLGNWQLLNSGAVSSSPFLILHSGTSSNRSRFYRFSTP